MAGVGKVSVPDSSIALRFREMPRMPRQNPFYINFDDAIKKHAYLDTERRSWSNAAKGNPGDIRKHPSHG